MCSCRRTRAARQCLHQFAAAAVVVTQGLGRRCGGGPGAADIHHQPGSSGSLAASHSATPARFDTWIGQPRRTASNATRLNVSWRDGSNRTRVRVQSRSWSGRDCRRFRLQAAQPGDTAGTPSSWCRDNWDHPARRRSVVDTTTDRDTRRDPGTDRVLPFSRRPTKARSGGSVEASPM